MDALLSAMLHHSILPQIQHSKCLLNNKSSADADSYMTMLL